MEQVYLQRIEATNNRIEYHYSVSEGLKSYFCLDIPYFIEYTIDNAPLDLHDVPSSVLAIPFVCNVLPIVWLTDSELIVPELDKDFYDSIPKFKQGYIDMHKDAAFKGIISVGKVVKNVPSITGRSAAFFSGGVDAWCTLTRHLDEKPDLITIWGSDIPCENISGWNVLRNALTQCATNLSLPLITIRSSFRKCINEPVLDTTYYPVLHDGWWHGAQHGIGLIGHAAPCNYLRGVTTQYIAASFSPEDGQVSCASWPTIDNFVRYAGCQTIHDAFITRQQKIKEIVNFSIKTNTRIPLHVCWKTIDGHNCGKCEKCCRTILALIIEDGDPNLFGFDENNYNFIQMRKYLSEEFCFDPVLVPLWKQIQSAAIANDAMLRSKPYYKDIKWIETFDFDHPERYWKRRLIRVARCPLTFARRVKGKIKHLLGM